MAAYIEWELHWMGVFFRLFWLKCADERYMVIVSDLTLWCGMRGEFEEGFIPDNDNSIVG